MPDILSQGRDRDPRPWPRRLVAVGAVVLAAALITLYATGHARSPAHTASATPSAPAPLATGALASGAGDAPDGVTGPTLRWGSTVALPLSGDEPSWLWPATGRTRPIGGLPASGAGYQFTRISGGWAVQVDLAGSTACSYCNTEPLPVYFLGDQARTATKVGSANLVAPGAGTGQMWLTSYSPGADTPEAAGTAQEVSAAGAALGPRLTLPAGQVIEQATDRGLLLAPAIPRPGTTADTLWNPASGRPSRTFNNVVAASPTEIAWAPPCAETGSAACHVQILDLATGNLTTAALPAGSSAASGAFSPAGQFLAVEASFYDGGSLAAQLDVVSLGTGQLTAVPSTWVSSDALVGFGWPNGGDSLVAELSFTTTIQVTSWRPGAADLAVAALRPGRDSASLVVG
jgi:hypothetical protein